MIQKQNLMDCGRMELNEIVRKGGDVGHLAAAQRYDWSVLYADMHFAWQRTILRGDGGPLLPDIDTHCSQNDKIVYFFDTASAIHSDIFDMVARGRRKPYISVGSDVFGSWQNGCSDGKH